MFLFYYNNRWQNSNNFKWESSLLWVIWLLEASFRQWSSPDYSHSYTKWTKERWRRIWRRTEWFLPAKLTGWSDTVCQSDCKWRNFDRGAWYGTPLPFTTASSSAPDSGTSLLSTRGTKREAGCGVIWNQLLHNGRGQYMNVMRSHLLSTIF